MKKCLLILTLLLGSFSVVKAQDEQTGNGNKKQADLQALYVAYVTQQLQLTPEEAQKFWPLHTQFEAELKGVNKGQPELIKEQARLDIKKKYQDGFSKIVGAGRCERFYRLGDDFRRKLLERRAQKQENRPNMRRGQ